ncbi:MAG: class II aldolase/adducin family protein [Xanthomonadales bacterium]|nr:class II aldolase/adducin family protein [Xanthomonadales bacterium]
MDIDDPRLRIAMARRMLYRSGCDTGIAQHVSERSVDGRSVFVSALDHGDRTTPGGVGRFDLADRTLVAGAARTDPPLEYAPEYVEIYECCPMVRAIVHTHSFWTMVLCTTGETIGMFNTTASLLADEQVAWQDDIFESTPRGERIATALDGKRVLLMRNHGLVVAAESLEVAVVLAGVVEEQARLHLEARRHGGREMPSGHVGPMRRAHQRTYVDHTWAANVRRLRVTDPDLFVDGAV